MPGASGVGKVVPQTQLSSTALRALTGGWKKLGGIVNQARATLDSTHWCLVLRLAQ